MHESLQALEPYLLTPVELEQIAGMSYVLHIPPLHDAIGQIQDSPSEIIYFWLVQYTLDTLAALKILTEERNKKQK